MDHKDFEALHAALAGEVYRYAARRSAHHIAEDVVAETFTALWTRRQRIPIAPDEQRAWVFAVARNQLAQAQRTAARQHSLRSRWRVALQGVTPPTTQDVALDVLASESAGRVWRMLSPEDQEVLSLVAWEGLEPQEVATVLGISLTAVTSRVHRARVRIESLQRLHEGRHS